MDMWSVALRILLIWILMLCHTLLFLQFFLGKKRSQKLFFLFSMGKGIVVNIFMVLVLNPLYGDTFWYRWVYSLFLILTGVLPLVLECYTYRGSLLKIGIFAMLAEIHFMLLYYPVILCVNIFEGREEVVAYYVEFQLPDILVLIVLPILWYFESRVFRQFAERIRSWEPRARVRIFLWIVFGLYLLIAYQSMINTLVGPEYDQSIQVFMALFCNTGLIAFLIFFFSFRSKQEKKRRRFLSSQQRLMAIHYEAVRRQIREMEENQELVDRQMEEILKLDQGDLPEGRLKEYLGQLSREYHSIRAGVYCDYWMIDAVLYHMGGVCEREKIPYSFSFRNAELGKIRESDASELIFMLLDTLVKDHQGTEEIRFAGGNVNGTLTLTASLCSPHITGRLKRRTAEFRRAYGGELCFVKRESGYTEMVLQIYK